MNSFLIFIFGVVVGGAVVFLILRKGAGASVIDQQALDKKKNKESLLDFIESQGRITNDQIQHMLGLSDATATRYLDELEKEGKIRQVGDTGQGVYYEKV